MRGTVLLSVLGADPQRCGYTGEQIAFCLEALATKKVNQLGSDAAHLFYLLNQKGLVPFDKETAASLKARPFILKLRFDRERSTIDGIPVDFYKVMWNDISEHLLAALNHDYDKGEM